MRIEDLLRRNALRHADEPAIICPDGSVTWSKLDERSNRLASALTELGHTQAERISIVMADGLQIVETHYALWKCNYVVVALIPRLSEEEIARVLLHSGATALITDSPHAVAAAARAPKVRTIVVRGEAEGGTHTYDALMENGSDDPLPRLGGGADLRSLSYTSGTTGEPKGCMTTHQQQLASAANYLVDLEVPRHGPSAIPLPLSLGVGGFFMTMLSYLAVPLVITGRFNAKEWLDTVADQRVVHAFLVTTQVVDVISELNSGYSGDLRSLELLGYGGSPISWATVETLREAMGCRLWMGLGATEAGGQVSLLSPDEHDQMLAEPKHTDLVPVGRPAAYAQLRIVDDNGRELPVGVQGELQIKSASTFSGYWCQPEESLRVLRDGWLCLGDIAYRDAAGNINLVDRKAGVIRSGSQNIHAAEVEAVMQSHEHVHRAAVLGVPDERMGEVVAALVVRVPGSSLTADELLAHFEGRLARFKRPRSIMFVDDLPINDTGKVIRSRIAEFYKSVVAQ